jgi:hypothetical protein
MPNGVFSPINPGAAFQGGYTFGAGIRQREQSLARSQQASQALNALANNPNATTEDYTAIMAQYPEMSGTVQQIMSARQVSGQRERLAGVAEDFPTNVEDLTQILLRNPDIASQISSAFSIRQKQAELERRRAEAEVMKSDMAELAQKDRPTADDYSDLILRYPTLKETFESSFKLLSAERKEAQQNQALRIFTAMEAGQVNVAKSLLESQKVAAENSGIEEDAKTAEAMISLIDNNPDAAKTAIGLQLSASMGPEKFAEKFADVYGTLRTEERRQKEHLGEIKKQAAELGLTKAQVNKALAGTQKMETETKILLLKLEKAKLDPEIFADQKEVFDAEMALRDELFKKNKDFIAVQESARKIETASPTAAGDISLVFAFMKMIDPTSTVREGEQATARNAAGLPEVIRATWNGLLAGESLGPSQRAGFKAEAKRLLKAATIRNDALVKRTNVIVKNYELNPDNVFLAEPTEETETPIEEVTPGAVPPTAPQRPVVERSYLKYATPED